MWKSRGLGKDRAFGDCVHPRTSGEVATVVYSDGGTCASRRFVEKAAGRMCNMSVAVMRPDIASLIRAAFANSLSAAPRSVWRVPCQNPFRKADIPVLLVAGIGSCFQQRLVAQPPVLLLRSTLSLKRDLVGQLKRHLMRRHRGRRLAACAIPDGTAFKRAAYRWYDRSVSACGEVWRG